MATIERDVSLLQRRRVAPIYIVYGSAVQIRLNMIDYTIPENATVEFFAQCGSGPVYRCSGSAIGNSAVFTPPEGFFQQGGNALQLEINGRMIPLAIDVKCEERISGVGSEETPEQVRPLVLQAQDAAQEARDRASLAAGYATSAGNSANAAAVSAELAGQSATNAGNAATSAGQSANAAAGSANAALESQNAAAGSAGAAEKSAEEAIASQDAAARSAAAADGSADAAGRSASAAEESANESRNAASAAGQSANSAAGSAQAAQEAMAQTAKIAAKTPYIGDNGNWFVWASDADAYVDSGIKAQGPQGVPGTGNVSSVCGVTPNGDGDVTLTAADVGAKPDNWMPTAADVGARPDNWVPTAADVGALAVSGGAMSGPIAMGGKKVTGLGSPTATGDAANKEYVDAIVGKIYPVGAIYISTNNTSPAALFGGTWEQLKDQFLLGAGDTYGAGTTGGEADHTLTVDEMPSHTHTLVAYISKGVGGADRVTFAGTYDWWNESSNSAHITSAGGSEAHNNMPPYLAVYMWKRVA